MATDAVANQSISQQHKDQLNLVYKPTKPATPSLLSLSNPELDAEVMLDLVFEDIGGQELINIHIEGLYLSNQMYSRLLKC